MVRNSFTRLTNLQSTKKPKMKANGNTMVLVAAALTVASCAPGNLATLETTQQTGQGCGSTAARILEIDGKPVSSKSQIVTVHPGRHKVSFEYTKIVLTKTHNLTTVTSLNPIEATGTLAPSKTYRLDLTRMHFDPVDLSGTPLVDITGVGKIYEPSGSARIALVAK